MQANSYDIMIFIDAKIVTQDATHGTDVITWQSLTGVRPIMASFLDVIPRMVGTESSSHGLVLNKRSAKVKFPFRSDVDSEMRVRVRRGFGEETFQIIGGPTLVEGRLGAIELLVEKLSS